MVIKPMVKFNIGLNCHPLGCKEYVHHIIKNAKKLSKVKEYRNVLIIGGSSGYGLNTRILLSFLGNSNTINVSFENLPNETKTGSAGYWNNLFFQDFASQTGNFHKDFIIDAYSEEAKNRVRQCIKDELNGKIDLVIYSLASPVRPRDDGEVIKSVIKPIGSSVSGKSIDIATNTIKIIDLAPATDKEIEDTVYVMGGSDYEKWMDFLLDNDLVNTNALSLTYTYIGSEATKEVYRYGTIGKAKEDLEKSTIRINQKMKSKVNGRCYSVAAGAIVSKASVFIPSMALYASCLIDVMKKDKTYETVVEHIHRLFSDFDTLKIESNSLRIDNRELDSTTQGKVIKLMHGLSDEEILGLDGRVAFTKEFYNINGFGLDNVDYNQDVNILELNKGLK